MMLELEYENPIMDGDLPVTLTVVESRPNWDVIVQFDDDPPHIAYILSFHLTLEAALDSAYAYLYAAGFTNTYAKPKSSYRLAVSDNKLRQPHSNVALSDEAWDYLNEQTALYKYNGRASYLGVAVYLLALLDANPTPNDWSDNRHIAEPDLPEYNNARVQENKLPVWADDDFNDNRHYTGYRRRPRSLPTRKLNAILARLEPIAFAHRLTPTYEKRDLLRRRRWASAAIEAIGLKYFIAHNPPVVNPQPAKRDRRHHHDAAKSDERFPFF